MVTSLPGKDASITIGLISLVVMIVCDVILLGQPVSGWHYDIASFGAVREVGLTRAAIGAFGGALFGLLSIPAYLYFNLKLSFIDYRYANHMCIAFISMAFFNSIFHSGYFFLFHRDMVDDIFQKYALYLLSISGMAGLCMCVGTWYYIKLLKHLKVSKWYFLINPIVICGVLLILFTAIPAPVGGYLKPTFINLGLVLWLYAFTKYLNNTQ